MKKTRQRISKTASKKTVRRTRLATHNGTLDIENGLGAMKSARAIAQSVKKAADASEHLTTAPFHAAMAALDHLIAFLDRQKARLEEAKVELQKLYGETVDDEPNRRRMAAKRRSGKRSRKRGEMLTSSNLAWSGGRLLPT